MSFIEVMNYFYYRTSISELQALHIGEYSPRLSYHSMLYLNIISEMEDCTVSKLADLLKITRSAVTIKVGELVKYGFVTKEQSKEDGRMWYIRLSPKMADIYAMFERFGVAIEIELKQKYSDGEIELFGKMLRDVADCNFEGTRTPEVNSIV